MWWIQSLGNARVCLCIYEILSIFSNSWSFYLEVCKEKGRGGGDNQTVFDQESLGVLQ